VPPALRVGLTGGIGSGKSEVTKRLANCGGFVVDADQLARDVVAPGTEGLAEVVQAFGDDVMAVDGSLDRERLGQIVFHDPGKRARLNSIVHPRVAARAAELQESAPADAIVIYDVPLLVENDLSEGFDAVVVVDAPEHVQVQRLVTRRGMSEEHARARIAAQATRERRLAVADFVIDNSGRLEDLDPQVDRLWHELTQRVGARGEP
jgi:dephospho-CoA kinase